jgi:competence protein ComEA
MSQARLIQLDLNNATKESLQAHPYIRWQVAREIIAFRIQHGGYHSVDELLQLGQMDPVKFEKIKPYLAVKP